MSAQLEQIILTYDTYYFGNYGKLIQVTEEQIRSSMKAGKLHQAGEYQCSTKLPSVQVQFRIGKQHITSFSINNIVVQRIFPFVEKLVRKGSHHIYPGGRHCLNVARNKLPQSTRSLPVKFYESCRNHYISRSTLRQSMLQQHPR